MFNGARGVDPLTPERPKSSTSRYHAERQGNGGVQSDETSPSMRLLRRIQESDKGSTVKGIKSREYDSRKCESESDSPTKRRPSSGNYKDIKLKPILKKTGSSRDLLELNSELELSPKSYNSPLKIRDKLWSLFHGDSKKNVPFQQGESDRECNKSVLSGNEDSQESVNSLDQRSTIYAPTKGDELVPFLSERELLLSEEDYTLFQFEESLVKNTITNFPLRICMNIWVYSSHTKTFFVKDTLTTEKQCDSFSRSCRSTDRREFHLLVPCITPEDIFDVFPEGGCFIFKVPLQLSTEFMTFLLNISLKDLRQHILANEQVVGISQNYHDSAKPYHVMKLWISREVLSRYIPCYKDHINILRNLCRPLLENAPNPAFHKVIFASKFLNKPYAFVNVFDAHE